MWERNNEDLYLHSAATPSLLPLWSFYVPVCHISSQTKAGFEIRAEVAAAALTLRRV